MLVWSLLLAILTLSCHALAQGPILSIRGSNPLCAPAQPCASNPASAVPGTTASLEISSLREASHFLLLSTAPVTCLWLPGIGGEFASSTLLFVDWLPLTWRRWGQYPGPGCLPWIGSADIPVPAGHFQGTQIVAQVLAVLPQASWVYFSNGVTVTLR